MSYLVDTHCHLIFKDFREDLDSVINNAFNSRVKAMLAISTQENEFNPLIALTQKYSNIFCSIGIHPHSAHLHSELNEEKIIKFVDNERVIGIGETGLDFYYKNSEKNIQIQLFKRHINVSRETQLPIIIHTRDADKATIDILNEESKRGEFPGVIHCFTAGPELAKAALDLGFYISLSGIVTFKNAGELRETIKDIPIDRILVETDSPYLSPEPVRGGRNEPANVIHTAKYLAEFYDIDQETFYQKTTDNFLKLFNKAKITNE